MLTILYYQSPTRAGDVCTYQAVQSCVSSCYESMQGCGELHAGLHYMLALSACAQSLSDQFYLNFSVPVAT